MDGGNEQIVTIKFCFKDGVTTTETLELEHIKFSISGRKRNGIWREIWLSKIDSNWRILCCFCWFVQKWPSNCIKNDSNIFERPQACSSSRFWKRNTKWELGKEKVVCTFCSTLLDTWAKERSSHILPRHYRDGRWRQIIFSNIITGEVTWCFASEPKQSDRMFWMSWWDICLAEGIPKFTHQE
jgi:hypothetical protein